MARTNHVSKLLAIILAVFSIGYLLDSLRVGPIVYLFQNYSGHLLKASGFYFLYLGLFKSSIETPYENLKVTDQKLIREAEERYRSLFDNANDAIITTDLEDIATSWNAGAEKILGWTEREIIGQKLSPLIFDPTQQVERDLLIRNAISVGTFTGIETVLLRKDGTKLNVSMTVSPLRDANKNPIGISAIIRDITERKLAEEQIKASLKEKEVLLREIHHRVKNNMQIISSLLRLQSGSITEKKYHDMFVESQNRIIAMSLIHEKLYRSADLTNIDSEAYIKDLVNGLFQTYEVNTGKVALKLNVKNVSLGINSAIPCGLIINELVSNSLKYAFPGDRTGEITISLRSYDDNMIEMLVSDNGLGIPENMDIKNLESWGLRLVMILAENQLNGEINLYREKGTEFQIRFKDVK
ncbi:MAG: PAS domain S-box protein [Candidatus Methanoperedens sp.]|nr:PAS domain S-box protein [Candidatus Methanoperedens sp.]MCE8429808.1 PAS domain S-box protein [Candidatus Methanoperedens sp.]